MSRNTRTELKNLIIEKTGAASYALYRKIQEEMLPEKFIVGSSYDKNNAEIETILDEINQLFKHPSGKTSEEYYNSLSEEKKNYFFSKYDAILALNDLRREYNLPSPMVPRAATPPSASNTRQAIIQATPSRPPRRSRKTLKRKSRKNRK
jgi:hypothetical protein